MRLPSRYRRPRYGRFPWQVAAVLGALWLAYAAFSYVRSRETETDHAEPIYLRYVDRVLRIVEAGGEQSGLWRWLAGADQEQETLASLRRSMEHLAQRETLTTEGALCLALLRFQTGQAEQARAVLAEHPPESAAALVFEAVLDGGAPPEWGLEGLRRDVESNQYGAWNARVLALVETRGAEVAPHVWERYLASCRALLLRAQLFVVLGVLVLVVGLACFPAAIRSWRRGRAPPLPRTLARWSVPFVLGLFFAVDLGRDAVTALVAILVGWLRDGVPLPTPWRYGRALIWQAATTIALALLVFARPWHLLKAFGMTRRVPWAVVWAVFALLFGLQILAYLVIDLEQVVIDPTDMISWTEPGWQELLFIFLSGCIAAPLFEEIVFRGFLFLGLRERLGNWRALLVSSLVFAVVHSQYSWEGMLSVGAFGAGAAWLAWRSGSILPGMVLHMIYNLYLYALAYLMLQMPL